MTEQKNHAFVIEGKMALPYLYLAGAVGSRFIVALRDEKKILGVRCDKCNKTFVPPRQTCERCFSVLTDNWVEVGPEGTVTGFTMVRYSEPYQPQEPPYVLGLIKLDGADTAIAHVVQGRDVRCGIRVRAVFSEERQDNIQAISHFKAI